MKIATSKQVQDNVNIFVERFRELRDNFYRWRQTFADRRRAERDRVAEMKEIMAWLSSLNFDEKQKRLIEQRTEGTGRWFLESPQFAEWRDGKSVEKVFWCPGKRE